MQQWIVDTFTQTLFSGNPAAVCLPGKDLADAVMAKIARENGQPVTSFLTETEAGWRVRWMAPASEIDLCGHGALAAVYILGRFVSPAAQEITLLSNSGPLTAVRREGRWELSFPAYTLKPLEVSEEIVQALGARPREVWRARDLLCVFERPEQVLTLKPDQQLLKGLKGALMQVTAPGDGSPYHCVSRTFAPKMGLEEDPVCGSGHCHIVPYWAGRLGLTQMMARQASPRGGTLYARVEGDRVCLAGDCALYSTSQLMEEEME